MTIRQILSQQANHEPNTDQGGGAATGGEGEGTQATEGGEGEGEGEGGSDAAAAAAAAAAEKAKPTDGEAKLLKEVMALKERERAAKEALKAFEGLDPAAARAALEASKAAEIKALEDKGEYSRIIEQVREQSEAKVSAAEAKVAELQGQLENVQKSVERANFTSAFANSHFLRESVVISGSKVEALYGDHFDTVDGKIVGYDKPRGAEGRTPLVDANAQPLDFDAAIEKVLKSDPEWERLAKSKLKGGAAATPKSISADDDRPLTSTDRIAAGLKGLTASANPLTPNKVRG